MRVQAIEQLVHSGDAGLGTFDDALQVRGIVRRVELSDEHAERVQGLAQIVTCDREKARLGKVRFLQFPCALRDLALEVGMRPAGALPWR